MNKSQKRFPLPKRLSIALSEEAYAQLRALHSIWGLSNNYILVVLLEKLNELADPQLLDQAFHNFVMEYGSPNQRD